MGYTKKTSLYKQKKSEIAKPRQVPKIGTGRTKKKKVKPKSKFLCERKSRLLKKK